MRFADFPLPGARFRCLRTDRTLVVAYCWSDATGRWARCRVVGGARPQTRVALERLLSPYLFERMEHTAA